MRTPALLLLPLAAFAARASAGDVHGTVKYTGTPPKEAPFTTNRDQKVCGTSVPNEMLEISNGSLENVVITVSGAGAPKEAPKTITIDQHECRYHPHVQAAPVGSTLEILNSDPMLHNIHGYYGQQTLFNVAMPIKGQKIPKVLPRAGVVRIKCDVHNWMHGYVVVAEGPYAVVGKDGAYTIGGLPAGTYTVTAWHEAFGEKTSQVTVPATGQVAADFTFSGAPLAGAGGD
ncbi:MAG TPA: carboxypeptidase regulatory-like domain-containing protein [Anaeromyxobacter sp.]|nr:carboxypeptidase regulatory-like domain-containing protein [Anaeromyxobacter sp.]